MLNLKHKKNMEKNENENENPSILSRINKWLDFFLGEKKRYFVRSLCFLGIGLVVAMAYLALLSLAEGTKHSIFQIAVMQMKTSNFWLKVGMGILLGTSGVVIMFFRMFPWIKENPGWFTFILASMSIVLGIVGLNSELSFLSVVSNTVVIVLIIGYFSKPAYDNWKEIKNFNRRMIRDYGRDIGADANPHYKPVK